MNVSSVTYEIHNRQNVEDGALNPLKVIVTSGDKPKCYLSLGIQSYSEMMIGVSNHLSIVFRFHYHSQKVIGCLGFDFIRLHCC